MLKAILRGKLSSATNRSEDLLTAVAFGVLEHLPPALGIVPLLQTIEGPPQPPWFGQVTQVAVDYWPWWDEDEDADGAEPDVVLTLTTSTRARYLLVIEAKRMSGKSGFGKRDQLARQVLHGQQIADHAHIHFAGLVYLTAHLSFPTPELDASYAELARRGVYGVPLWWGTWRVLPDFFDRAACQVAPPLDALCRDASACLRKWGLERFHGFSPPPRQPTWRFRRSFDFSEPRPLRWRFRRGFDFSNPRPLRWRFRRGFNVSGLRPTPPWRFQRRFNLSLPSPPLRWTFQKEPR